MFSQKIFEVAVNSVEDTTGLKFIDFMQTRKSICVDARSILIHILKTYGMRESVISDLTSLTQQGINKLYNNHAYRIKYNSHLKRLSLEAYNTFTTNLQLIDNLHN